MKNIAANLRAIEEIAGALGELNKRVVFVGGALVSLYADDLAAEDVRPTKDIDITLEIATSLELEQLRQTLIEKGFSQSAEEKVICRFLYREIKVDVMSTKAVGWAPTNPWFAPGFKHLTKTTVGSLTIQLFPLAYFLASKFAAFRDRGKKDPRTSHDFEDITYILDNRSDLVKQILQSPMEVKKYLKKEFESILTTELLREAVLSDLQYETQTERFKKIEEKLVKIVNGV